jgi:Fe-S-cluster containining protein
MECRTDCGACCVAISISSPIPDMLNGKPAGVRCLHLLPSNKCNLFGKSSRPKVCSDLIPSEEMCGNSYEQALNYLTNLEMATKPSDD